MNKELLKRLWDAANAHCISMMGEYLADDFEATDEEPNAPMPEDAEEVLRIVADYLEGSV